MNTEQKSVFDAKNKLSSQFEQLLELKTYSGDSETRKVGDKGGESINYNEPGTAYLRT